MTWEKALFEPRHVAVVGSVSPGKIGRVVIDQLLDGGFTNVCVVNPKGSGDLDTRSVPAATSLRALSETGASIDLVIVASPAATVSDVLLDAGTAGAKVAVVITAGFSETGDDLAERALLDAAERAGVRVVGPNCAGIVNTKWDLFPTLETRPPTGDVAFLSQSGALGGAVLSWAEQQGVGFSKFVSYGNGADLTDIDFLRFLKDDAESRVVCLYVETVSDGRAFMNAAAVLAGVKPLIVIKAGRSASGRRATLSHTGSMAGVDTVYDAALRQCGAIRADGIEEMFDLCRAFTSLSPVRGRRLAIVTNSGGPAVLAADRAETAGFEISPPSAGLRERLTGRLESFCGFDNPYDLTVQGGGEEYRDVILAVAAEADAVLAIDVNVPYLDAAPIARGVVEAADRVDVPVAAAFLAGRPVETALPVLAAGGVPNFTTGERAVAAMASLMRRSLSTEAAGAFEWDDKPEPENLPWKETPTEPEVLDWLERSAVRSIERETARTEEAAVAAARRLGFPIVAKVVSREILHKTDVGGVALDLRSEVAVRAAFARLRAIGGGSFEGVLLSKMVERPVEAIVGLSRDPQFGPVVAAGLGGTHTEALGDLALRVAPVDKKEACAMLSELRGASILSGARGPARLDVDSLADLVVRVSALGVRYPDLEELDLNPVFLFREGCAVADARLIVSRSDLKGATSDA